MPIEILELVVRASVCQTPEEQDRERSGRERQGASAETGRATGGSTPAVQEAVEQVLEILRHEKER